MVNDVSNERLKMVAIRTIFAGLCQYFAPSASSRHDGLEALDLMGGWHGRPMTFLSRIAQRLGWYDI
jgi:hypothetical protein